MRRVSDRYWIRRKSCTTFCDIQKPKNANQIFLDGDEIVEGTKREMLRRMEIVETAKRAQKAQTETQRSPSTNLQDPLMSFAGSAAKKRKLDVRVSQATSTAHAAMAAMGQAASLRQAAGPSIKSVKTTCREEFELYLSMCQDITIDDMAPTGAAMEKFWTEQVFILRTMIFVFRQIYAKPNSAGCLENDFSFAGKTLQPSRSMIDASIFDAQLMSCCNVREYLPAKKDIKEFKSISTRWMPCHPLGLEPVSMLTKTTKRMYRAMPRCLKLLPSGALCRWLP